MPLTFKHTFCELQPPVGAALLWTLGPVLSLVGENLGEPMLFIDEYLEMFTECNGTECWFAPAALAVMHWGFGNWRLDAFTRVGPWADGISVFIRTHRPQKFALYPSTMWGHSAKVAN